MVFAQPAAGKKDKVTAGTILKSVERILGSPRSEWNGPLLRALWPALDERRLTAGGSRWTTKRLGSS